MSTLPEASAADPLRTRLATALGERYVLERELGGGGMARVFLAMEPALRRRVVIKVVPPEAALGLSAERFSREMLLMASLQHAHIVPVLAAGTAEGVPWFAMPFVEGASLRARLAAGPLPEAEAIAVLRDVCRALAYAHERGIIHRDIKPDNILLAGEAGGDAAVVTDFGIAKAVRAARDDSGAAPGHDTALTGVGLALGTPAYMAPEQVTADDATDHRADLYALGCVAFELVTGHPPFGGSAHEVVRAHLTVPGPTPGGVSAGYAALVAQCLAKDPAQRPTSARAVGKALADLAAGGTPAQEAQRLGRGLAAVALSTAATYVLARAAVVSIGLPAWTAPLATAAAGLGVPAVLLTWWVQRTARASTQPTPPRTPGGTVVQPGPPRDAGARTLATLALRAAPVLTWRRGRRAGVVAVGAVALFVAAVMTLRQFGLGPAASLAATGRVKADSRLLVAAFSAAGAPDTTLGATFSEGVRNALEGASSLRVASLQDVGKALRQSMRDPATTVTPALARELAQRMGIPLVLTGRVSQAGTGFLITAQLVTADSGRILAPFTTSARDQDDLINAMDRLARDVRARTGESLRSVARTPGLPDVTTPSIVALTAYQQGALRADLKGDFTGALAAMREAIRVDTGFASALRKAARYAQLSGRPTSEVFALLSAANRHRDRLAGAELTILEGHYQEYTSTRQAANTYLAGDRATSLVNLGYVYRLLGQPARADSVYRAYHQRDSLMGNSVVAFVNWHFSQMEQERLAEARRTGAELVRRLPGNSISGLLRLNEAALAGGADSLARALATIDPREPVAPVDEATMQAIAAGLRGHLRDFARHALATAGPAGSVVNSAHPVDAALWAIVPAAIHRGTEREAVTRLDSLLRVHPQEGVPLLDRRDLGLALAYARLGRADRARPLVAAYLARLSAEERLVMWGEWQMTLGEIALAEGRAAEALRAFRAATASDSGRVEPAPFGRLTMAMARAFDRAGQVDSAIAHLEAVAEGHFFAYQREGPLMLPMALRRLGELYEARGDTAKAIARYQALATLWKDADPELQPQVRDVRGRVARLMTREAARR